MKLSQGLNDALNAQILIELGNQLKYMQISSYFKHFELNKLADYFMKQADDEKNHAKLFTDHINSRVDGMVKLGEVESPNLTFISFGSIGDLYLAIEEDTTTSIEELYDLALSEKSYMDLGFLGTMLDEQVAEEDEAIELSTKISNVKDIYILDATME